MQAIRPSAPGGPEVLIPTEIPRPVPGPGEALIRVEAAGVNFIDTYQRSGQYATARPIPLGLEGAGVVESVGPGTDWPTAGARVAWAAGPGSYATHVCVPAARLVEIPPGVDSPTAAAAMLQGMTAHYLARATYPLRAGETCLVHAAAGGVGQLLCQLARRAGARVLATVSTEEKARRARDAGADEVVLYTTTDFETEVRRLTDGAGVHVVYDGVGRDTFAKSLGCLRPRGMLVLFGQASGAVPPVDPQVLSQKGSLFLTRPTLAHYTLTPDELRMRAGEVLAMVASGELRIEIGATFPLTDAEKAHRALEGRKTTGKVLLIPA